MAKTAKKKMAEEKKMAGVPMVAVIVKGKPKGKKGSCK